MYSLYIYIYIYEICVIIECQHANMKNTNVYGLKPRRHLVVISISIWRIITRDSQHNLHY